MMTASPAHSIPILSPGEASQWDLASEAIGITPAALMENAGRAVVSILLARFGQAGRKGVLVAVGPGNNGGDGWVAARALHRAGIPVWVTGVPPRDGSLAFTFANIARQDGVREVASAGPWPSAGVVIDAVLGTGASGALRSPVRELVGRLADLQLPVIAIDGPTGLDLNDGVSRGPLRATLSVTFGGYRRGHLLARDDVGDVVVVDIGFGPSDDAWPRLLQAREAAALLPHPSSSAHKGTRGRVVIVGGSPGMTGAARLCARAAFGTGAGLVHLLVPPESTTVLATAEPDLQAFGWDLTTEGTPGPLMQEQIRRADVVVIGPGLGRSDETWRLVDYVLADAKAAVIDADALTTSAGHRDALVSRCQSLPSVLTPHAGEFRALFPDLAATMSVDPWGVAQEAADVVGATVLLKGVPTVIAQPGQPSLTVAAGNPGLATGGSGDVLSGIIAVLMAQGLGPHRAAAVAAEALGGAADLAARRAGARTMRPMDVIAALGDLWREWAMMERLGSGRPPFVLHELPHPYQV